VLETDDASEALIASRIGNISLCRLAFASFVAHVGSGWFARLPLAPSAPTIAAESRPPQPSEDHALAPDAALDPPTQIAGLPERCLDVRRTQDERPEFRESSSSASAPGAPSSAAAIWAAVRLSASGSADSAASTARSPAVSPVWPRRSRAANGGGGDLRAEVGCEVRAAE
jgi:hypothetical protein